MTKIIILIVSIQYVRIYFLIFHRYSSLVLCPLLLVHNIKLLQTYFNGVYGNPAVNFDPLHLSLLEQPVVSLEEESYKEVMTSFFFQGKTEMLQLNSELGASSCNISNTFVPGFLHESIIIGQTNNNAYQQATDLLVNLSKKLLNQNAKLLTTMLGKLIKQYKAKRNMMKLLKTHFGECF